MSGLSLMGGWFPAVAQGVVAVALIRAIGWRSRRWRTVWVPSSAAIGVLASVLAAWALRSLGLASEPAPWLLWLWVGLTGRAIAVVVVGWPGTGWFRRNDAVFAAAGCLLCTGLFINAWIGYFPTVYTAWNQLTGASLPHQTDRATLAAMQQKSARPHNGVLVPVTIGADSSQFSHREEFVYLPPAWFSAGKRSSLPVVMMIGGQFNTPADWIRAGDAVTTLDAFAQAHDGYAPVAVFVDSVGSFGNDTECVNGPRGNAAEHLTEDVVPYITTQFGVGTDPLHWGVVGFSAGGTCAVDLTVMHPDVFSVFVDIAGDLAPNAGTDAQTIERLFGGDPQARAAFDPVTVMNRHGAYRDVAGLFVVPHGGPDVASGYEQAARTLSAVGDANGIRSTVVTMPGKHVWPFAGAAFVTTLPWLASELDTPGADPAAIPAQ